MQVESREGTSELKKSVVSAVAGVTGGVVSTGIFHPLDLLRTRLSAQGFWASGRVGKRYPLYLLCILIVLIEGDSYGGLFDAIAKILRHEGVTGIYRGVGAAMLGSSLSWGAYLSAYHFIRPRLGGTDIG